MRELIARFILWALKPYIGDLLTIDVPFTTSVLNYNEPQQRTASYAHNGDAGIDVYPPKDMFIAPWDQVKIPVGIHTVLPDWVYAKVYDRSGMAAEMVYTSAGVIDSTYTGEYQILLRNFSNKEVHLSKYQAIAQVVIMPKVHANLEFVTNAEFATAAQNSPRGNRGFGSTDKQ